MEKSQVRKKLHKVRKALSKSEVSSNSNIICNNIISSKWYKDASTIMIYLSFENEVDTFKLIENALKHRKNVIVPVCTNDFNILPVKINSLDNLKPNKYGILEPENIICYTGNIDAVIVPGIAFDRQFNRVGFGKGYYDRFLSEHLNSLKIGLCHHCQVVDKIDADKYDIKMDIIITEGETIIKNG